MNLPQEDFYYRTLVNVLYFHKQIPAFLYSYDRRRPMYLPFSETIVQLNNFKIDIKKKLNATFNIQF